MGLLDQISNVVGGGSTTNVLERILSGNHQVNQPQSTDQQQFGQVIQQVPRDQLANVFSQAAQTMDGQQYRDHLTPGVGGTNPLGVLKGPLLGMVAGALLQHLMNGQSGPAGNSTAGGMGGLLGSVLGGGATGGGLGALLGRIPGLSTTNPQQMDESQVAALADYARQHDPDAFGKAMADVSQQHPAAVGPLLGNGGLSSVAQALSGLFSGGQ